MDCLTSEGIMQQGSKSSWTQIVNMIKETSCFVSNNSDEGQVEGREVRLPDNQIVNVGVSRFHAPEVLGKLQINGNKN